MAGEEAARHRVGEAAERTARGRARLRHADHSSKEGESLRAGRTSRPPLSIRLQQEQLGGVPARHRHKLPRGRQGDDIIGPDMVLLDPVDEARRGEEDTGRGQKCQDHQQEHKRDVQLRRAPRDALPPRRGDGVDEIVSSGTDRHTVMPGRRHHARRDLRGQRMVCDLQRLRHGEVGGHMGARL